MITHHSYYGTPGNYFLLHFWATFFNVLHFSEKKIKKKVENPLMSQFPAPISHEVPVKFPPPTRENVKIIYLCLKASKLAMGTTSKSASIAPEFEPNCPQ